MYIAGGGYSLTANSDESASNSETASLNNPYTTEYYADAEKAAAVTSVSIPASVESIDAAFFQLFPNATAVRVAADSPHYQSYNGMLFSSDLSSLLLVPEGMEGIAVLPDGLATVPACAFSRCIKLLAIQMESGSTGASALEGAAFTTQDGILYTADKTTLLAAPAGLGASAKIASECSAIAEGAFWGNKDLKTIVVSGTIKEITVNPIFNPQAKPGEVLVANADGDTLTAPVPAFMPETIAGGTVALTGDFTKSAWEAAGFTRFTTPAAPGEQTNPESGSGLAYTLLDDMTLSVRWKGADPAHGTVEIPAQADVAGAQYSVSTIAEGGFADQADLTKIVLPASLTSIGANAFSGCTGLTEITIPGSVATIADNAFANCAYLAQVNLAEGVRSIGAAAFKGTAMQEVVIPASVIAIGEEAFAACDNLQTVVALGTVKTVAASALQGVVGASIYVPYSADESYAWSAGAPAAGVHLLPYGLKLAESGLDLHVGQTAELFGGKGYLHAPGSVEAQFSYSAKCASVSEGGTVAAKQPGTTTVTVKLTLGDRTLANASCNLRVIHEPQPIEQPEPGVEGTEEGADEDDVEADPETGEGEAVTGEAAEAERPQITQEQVAVESTDASDRPQITDGEYSIFGTSVDNKPVEAAEDERPSILTTEVQVESTDDQVEPAPDAPALEEETQDASEATEDEETAEPFPEDSEDIEEDLLEGEEELDSSETSDGWAEEATSSETEDATSESNTPIFHTSEDGALSRIFSSVSESLSLASIEPLAASSTKYSNKYKISVDTGQSQSKATWTWGKLNSSGGWDSLVGGTVLTNKSGVVHHGNKNEVMSIFTASDGAAILHTYRVPKSTDTPSPSSVGATLHAQDSSGNKLYPISLHLRRTGYSAQNWYLNGTSATSSIDKNAVSCSTYHNKTINVNWKANTYAIAYNGNGATGGSTASTPATYDQNVTLRGNGFTRPGYDFKGWATSAGGAVAYNAGATVKNLTATQGDTITLYAVWLPHKYTFTFNPNGGNFAGSTANKTVDNYVNVNTTFPANPTRAGYVFAGWVIDGNSDLLKNGSITFTYNGSTVAYPTSGGAPVTWSSMGSGYYGNATFTALWRSTITLDKNTPPNNTSSTYATIYYYPGFGYYRTGYTGWAIYANRSNMATSSNGKAVVTPPTEGGYSFHGFTGTGLEANVTMLNEDCVLSGEPSAVPRTGSVTWKAVWLVGVYTVTLDPNGGSLPAGKSTEVSYTKASTTFKTNDTNISKLGYTPTRSGWTFVGWVASKSSNTANYDSWMTDNIPHSNWYGTSTMYGDYTLKAMWRAKITLNGHAPLKPTSSQVTQKLSSFYYYTDRGFNTTMYGSGSSYLSNTNNMLGVGNISLGFDAPTCTDDGWEFGGYSNSSTDQSAQNMCISSEMELGYWPLRFNVSGDTTWYAVWTGKAYTLTANANGGTQSSLTLYNNNVVTLNGLTYTYGDTKLPDDWPQDKEISHGKKMEVPTFTGWTFQGYYSGNTQYYKNDGTGKLVACEISNGLPKNLTIKAKWARNITLNPNEGTAGSDTKVSVEYYGYLPSSLASSYKPSSPTDRPTGVTWTFDGFWSSGTGGTQYFDKDLKRKYTAQTTSTSYPPSTLYAHWVRTITIDPNGGTGGASSFDIIKGNYVPSISSHPERLGYSLTGYYTAATDGTKTHSETGTRESATLTTNIPSTIYAQWSEDQVTITFKADTGGTVSPSGDMKIGAVSGYTSSFATANKGYSFDGWYDGNTKIENVTGSNTIVDTNSERKGRTLTVQGLSSKPLVSKTYTAKFIERTAIITFEADTGGSVDPSGAQTVNQVTGSTSSTATPDSGYDFDGWYVDGVKITSSGGNITLVGSTITVAGYSSGPLSNKTYIAKFKQHEYSIRYQCGICRNEITVGSTNPCRHVYSFNYYPTSFTMDDITAPNKVTIPELPARYVGGGAPAMQPYYEFTGWSGAAPAGMPMSFDVDSIGDKIYIINSKPREYTFNLDAGEGVFEQGDRGFEAWDAGHKTKRTFTVETGTFALPIPEWEGHAFDHWRLVSREDLYGYNVVAPETLDVTFTPSSTQYGNYTYEAVWESTTYQISYVLDDELGSGALPEGADNPLNYDYDSDPITLPIPTRVGYDFLGWTEDVDEDATPAINGSDPQIDVTIPTGSWGDRTFKAHWRAHKYDVAYDLVGGAWEDPQPDNPYAATYDQDVTIAAAPKRAGYIFQGWQRTYDTAEGQVTERLEPDETITRPNWIALLGTRADQRDGDEPMDSVTITALWQADLSVDMVVGSDGVHMGIALKGGVTRDPFELTDGAAKLKNRSSGAMKVVSVKPNPATDYDYLKNDALQLFREESSLEAASFTVRPAKGSAATTQVGVFDIAGSDRLLTLVDDTAYSSPDVDADGPNHARNWMMQAAGSDDELDLVYHLDMGSLQPHDVDLTGGGDKQLHVADLVYRVALVLP